MVLSDMPLPFDNVFWGITKEQLNPEHLKLKMSVHGEWLIPIFWTFWIKGRAHRGACSLEMVSYPLHSIFIWDIKMAR